MSFLAKLRALVEEPPPQYAFEIGPAGLAIWQAGRGLQFAAIEGLDREADSTLLEALLRRHAPNANGHRRPAAVILPDSAARVSLLDFDTFPRKAEEQLGLVKLRLKRTVPFDIESAVCTYQVDSKADPKVNVLAEAIALEKIAPVETAFRNAGFHPGFITVSSLAMAQLVEPHTAFLKLSGNHLSLGYFDDSRLRLYRDLELDSPSLDAVLDIVDPTLAYLADVLQLKPSRIDHCGLEELAAPLTEHLAANWELTLAPLRARVEGRTQAVDEFNAGLVGYLAGQGDEAFAGVS
ncbi:MAG: hypothetical protein NW208_12880 [Bryobacter sp.]|nr:hypothetical protein [Bryobacter sp.]